MNLAPTASPPPWLALGDALAIAVRPGKGFRAEDFAELHPGGKLGKRLAKVRDLMHSGYEVPVVAPPPHGRRDLRNVLKEAGHHDRAGKRPMRGVISDGDLRRLLEREGGAALSRTAGEAMNPILAP